MVLMRLYTVCLVYFVLQNHMLFGADASSLSLDTSPVAQAFSQKLLPYEKKEVIVANALRAVTLVHENILRSDSVSNVKDREAYEMRAKIFMSCVVEQEYIDISDESEDLHEKFFTRAETPRSVESVKIFKIQHDEIETFLYSEGLSGKFKSEQGLRGLYHAFVDTVNPSCIIQ